MVILIHLSLILINSNHFQILNLTGYHHRSSLDSWGIEDVVRSCINLTEFTPFTLESHYEVLKLVEGITPNIRKLNLNFIYKVESQHVKILVERCKKLKELNLRRTHICDLSFDLENKYLTCSSDKGTIHLFKVGHLLDGSQSNQATSGNTKSMFSVLQSTVSYAGSEWSFA